MSEISAAQQRERFGHALERYIYGELLKLSSWADAEYDIYGHRDKDQVEVDFVLEHRGGQVVGVEVKATASVGRNDFAGLRKLAALADKKFQVGVVLYDGVETLPMGEGLWAVPLASLWLS